VLILLNDLKEIRYKLKVSRNHQNVLSLIRTMKNIFVFFFLILSQLCISQETKTVVQFSGFVMTSDSLQAVPFTHISITKRGKVSTAGPDGFFSFAAEAGDTLYFTCIGFKPSIYILPKVLEKNKYSVIQLMSKTEYYLKGTVVYPWGDRDGFMKAFRDLRLPKDDLQRAEENMDPQMLAALAQQLQPNGAEASSASLRSSAVNKSYYGQRPPNNLLNPFAWFELYKSAKKGELKLKNQSELPPLKD
jgi:hypothetical protein